MKMRMYLPLFVLLTATVGCSVLNDLSANRQQGNNVSANANSSTTKTSTSDTEGEFSPSDDPKSDIEKMADRFLSQKAFRTKMTGTGDTPIKMEAEYSAPDRFRVKTGSDSETVIIGKDVYIKAGGKWQKIPGNIGSSVPDLRKSFDEQSRKWLTDVKYVGEETVNGTPSLVYVYHNKGPGGVGENDSRVWIAKSDGLPVKIEATYASGTLKTMLIEYEYDPSISIEPPVK